MGALHWYVVLVALLASSVARADNPNGSESDELSDEDLVELAEVEVIEIYDERPDKPFDRDTEVRLTGEELAARGAFDLKTALALIPEIVVREAGRGGFQVDIRGARKGEVSVLIDGVLVSDPYYGNFDVTTIPITDIVEIRVATTPQSPIDGPNGPGGVIEVHTRDAIGPQLIIGRLSADTGPKAAWATTARVRLAKNWALRLSGSGAIGSRDLPLPDGASIDESRRSATGAARVEYRDRTRRMVIDAFVDDRHYVSPPSDEEIAPVLLIDRQTTTSIAARLDAKYGRLQLQTQGFAARLGRLSRNYTDASFDTEQQIEDLTAGRVGGAFLATRPIGKNARWAASYHVVREEADVTNVPNGHSGGDVVMMELAGDLQYERRTLRLDGAVGLAAPFGVDANPWPEVKLVGKWFPARQLEFTATIGRKGRLPSLRERFDSFVGNPDLQPEIADHAEIRGTYEIDRVRVGLSPFYRHTTGTIRTMAGTPQGTRLVNTGTLDIYGVDADARVDVTSKLTLGAAYDYVRATSDTESEPLDFLPHHRAEASVRLAPAVGYLGVARMKYVSSAIDRTEVIPSFTLLEASFSAQLSRHYMCVMRIDDVLDARPESRAGYHAPGRVIELFFQGTWE